MTKELDENSGRRVFSLFGACGLLALVLITPPNHYLGGRNFFEVARNSQWRDAGDWLAAWCSLRIVLLSLSVVGLTVSTAILSLLWERINLARVLLLTTIIPGLGVLLGLYYLLKALL